MREIGTPLAVTAIYILTLLLPLHQAAGLQRDLAVLGFGTVGKVSICNPVRPPNAENGDDASVVIKCPGAGVSKNPFADALIAASPLAFAPAFVVVAPTKRIAATLPAIPVRNGLSRAPPALA